MNLSRRFLRGPALRVTHLAALGLSSATPFSIVAEFPKSGGTWLCRMLASALSLPFAQDRLTPVLSPAIVHSHWDYSPRLRNVIYLYRDGRDVVVSYYFHLYRNAHPTRSRTEAHPYPSSLLKKFPNGLMPDRTRQSMPEFIVWFMENHPITNSPWPEHVRSWMTADAAAVHLTSYEALLRSPLDTLYNAAAVIAQTHVSSTAIEHAVDVNSFSTLTGRRPGQEDTTSPIRKGVAGDWTNHFTRRAGGVFQYYVDTLLLDLGYADTASWWKTLPKD